MAVRGYSEDGYERFYCMLYQENLHLNNTLHSYVYQGTRSLKFQPRKVSMVITVRECNEWTCCLISYGLLCRKEATAMEYNAVLHTMVTSILTHGPNIMILLSVTVYTLTQQAFSEEDVSNHSLVTS